MRPIDLFSIILGALVTILLIDQFFRRRRAKLISGIGAEYRMNYSPLDRFALTERLMALPEWSMRASDLAVKDVLYATKAGMRCFVATVKCRWSLDQDPSRFIVRFFERADHQSSINVEWEASDGPRDDPDQYRKLLSSWCAGSPDASRVAVTA